MREVIPLLAERLGSREQILKRTLKVFRLTESRIDQELSEIDLNIPGVGIGFYPRFPQIHLVITSRGVDAARVKENLAVAEQRIAGRIGEHIFGYDDETMEGVVAVLLTDRGIDPRGGGVVYRRVGYRSSYRCAGEFPLSGAGGGRVQQCLES